MLSRTTQIEIDNFFDKVLCKETETVTSQAFFKARKNVSFDAFKELFLMSRKMSFDENKIKRYKGYRVFAIDGSELRLNITRDNSDLFSARNNAAENKSNARISLLHDVVSNFIIDAQIGSIDTDERTYAMRNLEYFSEVCNEKDIVIFDRGYPSAKMISFMSDMNCKYLMRLQKSTFKAVTENPGNDFWITVNCGEKACPARGVRVILNTGEVGTLVTNLCENEFMTNDFKRWGIETVYDTLKNKLLIERFSGRTTLAILQEALHKNLCKSRSVQARCGLRSKQDWGFPLNCLAPTGRDGMRAAGVNTVSARGKNIKRGNPITRVLCPRTLSKVGWIPSPGFDTLHSNVQTMFFDARYKIFRRLSSLVNDGLFFVILRN